MTRDEIIKMAREAGFSSKQADVYFDRCLERFAALVAAAEREACAVAAEKQARWIGYNAHAEAIAAAIRARGEK